jgi:2-polyprenyl-3-methyl-5-hydroxy-6-metoxy-1,4-benzoquinol methylase
VVPNLDFHIKQWLDANWNEASLREEKSDASYSFAGLFGWQRECNPKFDDYNRSYWDVHKPGYNLKRMRFLLERAGYVDIELEIKDDVHLVAKATKSMNNDERQIDIDINNVRADHLNRYNFAAEILKAAQQRSILDLACGIGYDSQILATKTNAQVLGVDIDQGAIDYASQHYPARQLSYECVDARKLRTSQQYDAIVSFETIEHVEFDRELLNTFYTLLKFVGTFICSTPNEDVMPFDKEKFRFHIKHYTVAEMSTMIEKSGFKIKQVLTQKDPRSEEVEAGTDGCFTIMVCQKPLYAFMIDD